MKGSQKKKPAVPRLPLEAVLKVGSKPITTKRGARGYTRKRVRVEITKTIREEGISP